MHLIIESKDGSIEHKNRLDEITEERNKNSEINSRLIKKLDTN